MEDGRNVKEARKEGEGKKEGEGRTEARKVKGGMGGKGEVR